jgi:DNA gyrase subunit A
MEILRPATAVLTLTENGFGKRTPIDDYRVTGRGGVGIINIQTTERNGRVVGVACVAERDEVMFMTQQGKVLRTAAGMISMIGRNTQGVRLIDMEPDDRAVSLARLEEQVEPDDDAGDGTPPAPQDETRSSDTPDPSRDSTEQ